MKYNCNSCSYSTNDASNWSKHKNTKRHLKKVQYNNNSKIDTQGDTHTDTQVDIQADTEISAKVLSVEKEKNKYLCPHCSEAFCYKSGLYRHMKHRCVNVRETKTDKELIVSLRKELDNRFIESINDLREHNKFLQSIVEKSENTTNEAIKTVKTSVNALAYVTANFTNAPLLSPIPNYSQIKKYCGEKPIGKVIADLYADDRLIKYLGEVLVQYYKKEDPHEQSLWNSDCSRLSYLIRIAINERPSWITDKKGVQLKDHIIKPLLDFIEKEILDLMKNRNNTIDTIYSCSKLLIDIRNSVISDDLIKYLAPYFTFSQKLSIKN
jgi:hypothetical protein